MTSDDLLTQQKGKLAAALYGAWDRYIQLFGEPPHGTLKQMNALVELMRFESFVKNITDPLKERT